MKYIVEIDASSKTGTDAINYLRKLKGKAVYIRKSARNGFIPLKDGELALPMKKKPTKAQLREYLDRDPGRGIPLEVARKKILDSPNKKRK